MTLSNTEKKSRDRDRYMVQVSQANQELAWNHVQEHRRKGNAAGTQASAAHVVLLLDRFLEKPIAQASQHDLGAWVVWLRDRYSPESVYHHTTCALPVLRTALGPDRVPSELEKPLRVARPRSDDYEGLISDAEFQALLGAVHRVKKTRHAQFLYTALLWLLRSCGPRISEALSLRLQDVDLRPEHRAFKVTLPNMGTHDGDLKTGTRTFSSVRAFGAVSAWMAVHPSGAPDAPLFVGERDRTGRKRLQYTQVCKALKAVDAQTGWSVGRSRSLRSHDFRHTCATSKVKNHGWGEANLRAFFGWTANSRMPAHYVHLGAADLYDQVLRDAGIDPRGNPADASPTDEVAQLKQIMRKLLHD